MLKFKELDDKKKRLIVIVSVLVVFIGVTLAYVVGQISDGAIGNANVTADTTDNLQFSVDKDISLNPTQFNVTEGGGGLSDTAVGTATLLANSTNKTATYDYYVYFNIKSNNYTYTTEDYKPEIVLTITDPEGNLVTELANSDLEYVEAENADGTITKGFDITTASGLINIASLYEITSSSSADATVQDWTFTVTFINLTTNQSANGGSTLDAEIILSKEATNYHEICEPGTMACDIARLYNEENPESNGLYYHNGTIVDEDENEYCVYDGKQVLSFPSESPSTNEEDCQRVFDYMGMGYFDASIITAGMEEGIVEEITWNNETCVTTTSGLPVYIYANGNGQDVAQEQCNGYAVTADTRAIILTEVGSGTIGKPILDAEDYSYRYSGANPNNYVCFGSNEETCSNDNLYRIIGVFDGKVKLIKYDYAGSNLLGTDGAYNRSTPSLGDDFYEGNQSTLYWYYWNNGTQTNTWSESNLNTINLNQNYLNNIGSIWQSKIAATSWKVGGNTYDNIGSVTVKQTYQNEIVNPVEATTYSAKIGLMYVSDYGYAANSENWTTVLESYDNSTNRNNNWMYMGWYDWTITRVSDYTNTAFYVISSGYLIYGATFGDYTAVRPVFYLNDNVKLVDGEGTYINPYRIA